MDKLKQFGLMEKIVHELEDLRNSQQALVQKLGKIEVDNIDLGDKKLEKELPAIHERVADNLDAIAGLLEDFAQKTQQFNDKNNIAALREQETMGKG